MPREDQLIFLKDALKAKGEFEKSARYHEALIRDRFGTDGIKPALIKAACLTVAKMQERLPSHGYSVYWVRNPDQFDIEDSQTIGMNPNISEKELPYTARLVQLTTSADGTKGAFTTREIIDAGARGRQFRWRAYMVGREGIPKEVAEQHAYEMEFPIFIQIERSGDSGFNVDMHRGEGKAVALN
jgi:hypothetical protein